MHKSELYFLSYSPRPITCVFDINKPKSFQYRSKVPLWPHILLTQLDEILIDKNLVISRSKVRPEVKMAEKYVIIYSQIIRQSINFIKLCKKNVRSKWYFWPILEWFGLIYAKNTCYRSRAITYKSDLCKNHREFNPKFSNFWSNLLYSGVYCFKKIVFDELLIFSNNYRLKKINFSFPEYDWYQKKRSVTL